MVNTFVMRVIHGLHTCNASELTLMITFDNESNSWPMLASSKTNQFILHSFFNV